MGSLYKLVLDQDEYFPADLQRCSHQVLDRDYLMVERKWEVVGTCVAFHACRLCIMEDFTWRSVCKMLQKGILC